MSPKCADEAKYDVVARVVVLEEAPPSAPANVTLSTRIWSLICFVVRLPRLVEPVAGLQS